MLGGLLGASGLFPRLRQQQQGANGGFLGNNFQPPSQNQNNFQGQQPPMGNIGWMSPLMRMFQSRYFNQGQ